MTEIYRIIHIETHNDFDDPYIVKTFMGLWEKDGEMIRNVRWDIRQFPLAQSGSIIDTIRESGKYNSYFDNVYPKSTIDFDIQKTNQKRGYYYPRIYRQIYSGDELTESVSKNQSKNLIEPHEIPINKDQLTHSLEQLTTLTELLGNILRTVFPNPANFETYGFDIRNLIILTATEFETQITGILKANAIEPINKYYTTVDFYKLKDVLRLSDYQIRFTNYPDIPVLSPFSNWNIKNTTSSLEWYANYNAIKHDRENNFSKGKLVDLLNSISACYVLIIAQYGNLQIIKDRIKNYWQIETAPAWDITEKLIKPYKDNPWKLEKYNC
jgi:hypothetical protein